LREREERRKIEWDGDWVGLYSEGEGRREWMRIE
jgi:hypothetical protein